MDALRIWLFGRVRVAHGASTEIGITRSAQMLLAFLLLHPNRYHPRDVLAELAWGDRPDDQARGALNTALWRLRHLLEPAGTPRGAYLRTTTAGEIGFNWDSDYWLDLAAFEKCANYILAIPTDAMQAEHARQLEAILPLCAGELLEGFYADWAVHERERLRDLVAIGFDRVYVHHVGQEQLPFLDAFGERHCAGGEHHLDQIADDQALAFAGLVQVPNQRHVEFYEVRRRVGQLQQTRLAGAEIVIGEADIEPIQTVGELS